MPHQQIANFIRCETVEYLIRNTFFFSVGDQVRKSGRGTVYRRLNYVIMDAIRLCALAIYIFFAFSDCVTVDGNQFCATLSGYSLTAT